MFLTEHFHLTSDISTDEMFRWNTLLEPNYRREVPMEHYFVLTYMLLKNNVPAEHFIGNLKTPPTHIVP
ncbi:hypothetical protein, partial [Flavobacterium branchiicola]|uniref:hypothetical protein n=1 Tax=Flavobacterium branchiicola TaxID=1114875 RepID=UPI001BCB2159